MQGFNQKQRGMRRCLAVSFFVIRLMTPPCVNLPRRYSWAYRIFFLVLISGTHSPAAASQRLRPADVVSKHLESIGSAKARESVKTRIISGTAQVIFRTTPPGQAIGRAVLASDGNKHLLGMSFPSPVYPREHLGFNGTGFIAAFVTPGVRSVLGNFLMTNEVVSKQGLMGGALSSAWPLNDLESRNTRLEYIGTRSIYGRTVHEIRYFPQGGSDLKITMLFEQETFRHVRTEYERVIPAQLDTRSMTNIQTRESRYKMIEDFSLFKKEGELTLPHIYTITLSVDTQGGTFLAEWTLKLVQFSFNEKIDPASFSISARLIQKSYFQLHV